MQSPAPAIQHIANPPKPTETEERVASMKAIYLIPAPDVNEENLNSIVNKYKNSTSAKLLHPHEKLSCLYKDFNEVESLKSLPLTDYTFYQKHKDELEKWGTIQLKGLHSKYSKDHIPLDTEILYLPTNDEELERMRTIIRSLKDGDILNVHCHANNDQLVVGPFRWNAERLAQTLKVLGLNPEKFITVGLWGCNTAYTSEKSITDKFKIELKKVFKNKEMNLMIAGHKGYLVTNPRARIHYVYSKTQQQTKLYGSNVMHTVFSTPNRGVIFSDSISPHDGPLTLLKKAAKLQRDVGSTRRKMSLSQSLKNSKTVRNLMDESDFKDNNNADDKSDHANDNKSRSKPSQ